MLTGAPGRPSRRPAWGARLYNALLAWDRFVRDPGGIYAVSGQVFYGGFLAATVAVSLYVRWKRYPLREVADVVAPAIPLGTAIGRVGCLLAGDDYGTPTDLPWAMTFPLGAPPTTTPVHPTQIYLALAGLVIFAVLWLQRDRPARPGFLFFQMLLWMGLARFVVEFWRTNPPFALGLTQAQWTSLALGVAGMVGVLKDLPAPRCDPLSGRRGSGRRRGGWRGARPGVARTRDTTPRRS